MAITFDTTYYLQQYPDVAVAISRGQIQSAQQHYNDFGRFESRNPSAFFDTTFYLQNNPDVAAARVNPFQHFLTFGAAEGRFATASADSAIDTDGNNIANEFNSAAYLAANTDVAANVGPGKAFATAYQHYIIFGQFESRPGVPVGGPFANSAGAPNAGSTFTLTTGIDSLTGTANNDIFRGDNTTTQVTDTINGGSGRDTFQYIDNSVGGSVPTLSTTNVEVISIRNIATSTTGAAGTNETASFTFGGDTAAANGTLILTQNGATVATYTIPSGSTGAQVAGIVAAAPPAGFTVASGAGNQLTLRSTTTGNVDNLAISNTSTSAAAGGSSVIVTDGVAAGAGGAAVVDNVNAANFSGAQDFISENSTNAVVFNGLTQGQSLGVTGNGATTNGATTGNYVAGVTSATINIAGGTLGTGAITAAAAGAGLTSATINSTGAANTVGTIDLSAGQTITALTINATTGLTASLANDFAAASTLTIAGAGAVNLSGTALSTAITTINASASTGGVNVLADGTANVSCTGGSGNDRIAVGASLTNADTLVGGAGTDTVSVTGADFTAAGQAGQLAGLNTKVTGFEVLEFTGTAATAISGTSFTNTEITKILFNTSGVGTLDTVEAAGASRTYAFGEINEGAATLNGSAGVTAFNVALEGIATNGANVSTLTANFTNSGNTQVGTGTINIASTGANGTANTIETITGTSNGAATALTTTSVVITGSHDLNIGTAVANGTDTGGFTTAANVNASAFTGKLSIIGSTGQDIIVGGSGNDTIHATAGGDTYTGGAGSDTFVFDAITDGNRSNLTTITDFVSGTDKLNFADVTTGTGVFNATAVNVSNAVDFTAALNLAAAGTGAVAGQVTYFQQGGNTFVVVDNSADATFNAATDMVVRLTGLVTLTATDVVA